MPSLLVTNDFPPKLGGIQSYLYELWRRLPPADTTVLTTPYDGAAAWDAQQPFRVVPTKKKVLLTTAPLRPAQGLRRGDRRHRRSGRRAARDRGRRPRPSASRAARARKHDIPRPRPRRRPSRAVRVGRRVRDVLSRAVGRPRSRGVRRRI